MTKSFFFYGMYEGNEDEDPTWKVLHEHFEKLAREDADEEELARADDDGFAQAKTK